MEDVEWVAPRQRPRLPGALEAAVRELGRGDPEPPAQLVGRRWPIVRYRAQAGDDGASSPLLVGRHVAFGPGAEQGDEGRAPEV